MTKGLSNEEIFSHILGEWLFVQEQLSNFLDTLEISWIERFGNDPGTSEIRHMLVDAFIANNADSPDFVCSVLSSALSRIPEGAYIVNASPKEGDDGTFDGYAHPHNISVPDAEELIAIGEEVSDIIGGEIPNIHAVATALSVILSRMPTASYEIDCDDQDLYPEEYL